MTPEQHQQRIRQLEFELHRADYGMGMPRDYQKVRWLRAQLEQARKEAAAADHRDRCIQYLIDGSQRP